ncbi:MAG TPA: TIGR03016 family PEP-CTERM system-associated outer membrane protein [Thermodesulforhabdus norvegica]|uniref:TIGR03016 family PEP-CTERM system-associated outer membrane protein n=1 Tax=Thermodesulforhabdus norvegica TaxID=39841 RepID=A0A7C1AUL8_9BACT|nr:MAG: TIGR03016 family PEP-CTERM system-associated outer membrane protein [Gammaproteobacteria bacterium]HDL90099.1 TIGR03016 family PEP-CTERM system-associated outer membrane protein [Thermodesulforhabdus norvegica]
MGTEIMRSSWKPNSIKESVVFCARATVCTMAVTFFLPAVTQAGEYNIYPRLSLKESYSDNINLDSSSEESAFVTEIIPGVSVKGVGGRFKVDLDYQLQQVFRSAGDEDNSTYHQLQADATTELTENFFFLDADATVGQTSIVSTGTQSADNISGSRNRQTFWTAGFSPYLTPHMNGYMDGEIRYKYDVVRSDGGVASDSEVHQQIIDLRSGHRLSQVTWSLDYSNVEEKRDSNRSNDTQYRSTNGEVRLRINSDFSTFIQAGNYRSDFRGDTGPNSDNNDGSYTTVGASWEPNAKVRIEGGVGKNNSFVTVDLTPSVMTSWLTTLRDSDVGTNTGKTWRTAFTHRAKNLDLGAVYFEDTTTYQQSLLEQDGLPTGTPQFTPTARDEVFTRKRGELSFTGATAKSTFNLGTYTEKRSYQVTGQNEDVFGWDASWNWRLTSKTNSVLRFSWQKTDSDNLLPTVQRAKTESTFTSASLRLNRRMTEDVNGNLELLRAEQDSDGLAGNYVENRITAGITIEFN